MQISTQEITGNVILYPLGNAEEKPGWMIREVQEIPSAPGLLKWNSLSNQLERVAVPVRVPGEVLSWRIRAMAKLTPHGQSNLAHTIEALILTLDLPDRVIADRVWNQGISISRTSPIVAEIVSSLSLTEEEIDQLFIQASQLPA